MTAAITVLGEALIDIVIQPSGSATEHVGGSPANVAVGMARLGHETTLITHIGTDEHGERISRLLSEEGVTLAPGSRTAIQTPTATAHLDADGVATYDFELEWWIDGTATIPHTTHVHTGSIAATLSPGAESVRRVIESARLYSTVSYDPNVRPSLMGDPPAARALVEEMVALADIVKASEEDIAWLYPGASAFEVLHTWASWGPRICAVTSGRGPVVAVVDGHHHEVAALGVPVADTVGAGDSFMAGLLSALLDAGHLGGADARQRLATIDWHQARSAVERAIRCSAITVGRVGANPPTRAELGLVLPATKGSDVPSDSSEGL